MVLSDAASPAHDFDDLDALFQDPTLNDIIRNQTDENHRGLVDVTTHASDQGLQAENGLDDEIKITKKRAPIAKLDDTRLLSPAGIPKLRKISKQKLKFRGKGHEFSDVAMLLRTYQFWLDDLYPRAKFADGLSIIEKVGHSKRMQLARKEWIDESKPKAYGEDREPLEATTAGSADSDTPETRAEQDLGRPLIAERTDVGERGPDSMSILPSETGQGQPEEDELDALLAEQELRSGSAQGSLFGRDPVQGHGAQKSTDADDANYDDDEAALREMEMDFGG